MGEGSWRVGSSHLREALGERQHVLEKVLAAQLARHLPHLPRHARHAKGGSWWWQVAAGRAFRSDSTALSRTSVSSTVESSSSGWSRVAACGGPPTYSTKLPSSSASAISTWERWAQTRRRVVDRTVHARPARPYVVCVCRHERPG